jgi:hypothetical protein
MRSWLVVVLLAIVSSGCNSIFGVDDDDIERAERRWAREGPLDYSYVLQRNCFCGGEVTGAVRITVENRVVISRRYVETGEPVPQQWESLFPAIEGVFQIVRDAMRNDADEIDARYDGDLGHPIHIFIDYIQEAADDELGLELSTVQKR